MFIFYSTLSLSLPHSLDLALCGKNFHPISSPVLFYIRSEVVMEVVNERKQKGSSSLSFPNEYSGDALDNHSSPSLTDGGDSLAQASLPNASFGHVPTSDNGTFLQNNGTCSPDVHKRHKVNSNPLIVDGEERYDSMVTQRPKSVGKYAESNAALSSFEAILGTLTRTKDCIGRATRLAIDCAKLGVSSKVQELFVFLLFNSISHPH